MVGLSTGIFANGCQVAFGDSPYSTKLQTNLQITGISGALTGLLGFGLFGTSSARRSIFQPVPTLSPQGNIHARKLHYLLFKHRGFGETILTLGLVGGIIIGLVKPFGIEIANEAHVGGVIGGMLIGFALRAGPFTGMATAFTLLSLGISMAKDPLWNPRYCITRGMHYYSNGEFDKAVQMFENLVKMTPKESDAWAKVLLSLSLAANGQSQEANAISTQIFNDQVPTQKNLRELQKMYELYNFDNKINQITSRIRKGG